MKPKRIQRKRTKGWRMPENTIYVGRGSRWGNPFVIVSADNEHWVYDTLSGQYSEKTHSTKAEAAKEACELYEFVLRSEHREELGEFLKPLKGKDLACWCKLDQPCHADVLLEIANNEKSG